MLSDWLTELEQGFQLREVNTDKAKITWCQLLIGATGSSILAGLEDDATWEVAKEMLLSRLGAGSVRDEAWASLKQLKRGSKEIIELAGEAEKLAKRLHPRNDEAAERHAVDAFLGALDRPLAAEGGSPETQLPHHGRSGRRCSTDRENPRGAAHLWDSTNHPVHAEPDPNPHQGFGQSARTNSFPGDGRYPYRCVRCPTQQCGGGCPATTSHFATSQFALSRSRSHTATTLGYGTTTPVLPWPLSIL